MPSPADFVLPEDKERALLRRLMERDPTAFVDLANLFLDYLVAWLAEHNRNIPEELCVEAAEDALIALKKSPASFDPGRGTRLAAYLRMSAQGDLRNILQRQGCRHANQVSLEDVELSPEAGKYLGVDEDPLHILELREESAKAVTTIVTPVREGLSDAESRALDLLLQGEKKTAIFAEAMGISHLPVQAQKAEVNRVKNMLKKRIDRKKGGDDQSS